MRTNLILFLFLMAQSLCAEPPSIRVEAGTLDRLETIVSTPFDFSKVFPGQKADETHILLSDGDRKISGQWFASNDAEQPGTASTVAGQPGELLFVLQKPLLAGETRTYTTRSPMQSSESPATM